ncbi:hypothetical protein [Vibrio phage vB_VmeM-Yong XC32]|nr:hypothetical protein [Vibrio phage vB_VmeM-Yong XC31]QAX96553.1 hypothetical protein [Vibrio phage vB_VmeM-Yong XC32]QAX96871.1 hypothetical protein [Vibrio phage vB_VmeM-Yong MS31]QAX97176.1 hypothetical protein [Vibrio phage vB_VmeM-Yong MS32]
MDLKNLKDLKNIQEVPWKGDGRSRFFRKIPCVMLNRHSWVFDTKKLDSNQKAFTYTYCQHCGIPHIVFSKKLQNVALPATQCHITAIEPKTGYAFNLKVLDVNYDTGVGLVKVWRGNAYSKERFIQLYNLRDWSYVHDDFLNLRNWEIEREIELLRERNA